MIFLRGSNEAKMSLRLIPLVSGIIKIQKNTLAIQIVVNINQTISIPKFDTSDGYIFMTANIIRNAMVCTTPFIVPEKKVVNLLFISNKLSNIRYIIIYIIVISIIIVP